MADGAERQNAIEAGVYDPRRDANWQARLEEARAKREIALRAKQGQNRPKRRLKPWEEEGAAVLDDDADVTPQPTGLEFSDRVDAMRTRAAPETPKHPRPVLVEPDPVPDAPGPGSNWSPEAEQNVLPLPVPARVPREEAPAVTQPEMETRTPSSSVNDIFADPVFHEPHEAAATGDDETAETIPISLLRAPPPEPVRRRIPEPEVAREETDAGIGSLIAAQAAAKNTKPKKKRSGLWTVAALFAGAIAIGPIYKMTQPIERGPLVFTLSSFPIEPAFGLTGPMLERPATTRSREWTPASLSPTDEPLALAKPNVPERARVIADFAVDPAFGATLSGILLGAPLAALPDTPAEQPLPVVLPERPIGPEGQVTGLAISMNDVPMPAPRPVLPENG